MTRRTNLLSITALLLAACGGDAPEPAASPDTLTPAAGAMTISGEFRTPESVLHDPEADVYLVSNIDGAPLEKDGNGFISRVRPDGTVEDLRWIDGAAGAVRLSAPKGMAIRGDSLFVTDIDSVRIFHRTSGEPQGAWGVPGATFLNDLAVGEAGLYVSDTGLRMGEGGFEPSGTDAVWLFDASGVATSLSAGPELMAPNGLVAEGSGVVVAPFGGSELLRVNAQGERSSLATLPAGQLDGLVRLDDGSFLVSSWEGGAVYRVRAGGEARAVVEGLEAPADIGWDAGRDRLLIPLFNANRIEVREIAPDAPSGEAEATDSTP
ncbi:MAG TPA: hypothetical protein VMK65_03715 [Longimicrobiales bacterium]|nr:hypothetical protein [Longimicrobiales bacterium]